MTISTLQAEVFEAFRDMGAAEDKALKAATILGKRDDAFTKAVTDFKLDVAGVKGELILYRWVLGFVLASNVAILFKIFAHESRSRSGRST